MIVLDDGIGLGQHDVEVVPGAGSDLQFAAHRKSKQLAFSLAALIGRHAEHDCRAFPALRDHQRCAEDRTQLSTAAVLRRRYLNGKVSRIRATVFVPKRFLRA